MNGRSTTVPLVDPDIPPTPPSECLDLESVTPSLAASRPPYVYTNPLSCICQEHLGAKLASNAPAVWPSPPDRRARYCAATWRLDCELRCFARLGNIRRVAQPIQSRMQALLNANYSRVHMHLRRAFLLSRLSSKKQLY